jgi:hypothetical protein
MKRFLCVVLVALSVAAGAAAKEGAQAHLLSRLPINPTPGTLITVRWRVDVPAPNGKRDGLSAVGMLVRLVGPTGAATVALARENAGPPYSARVRVPKGGIRLIRFGVASSTPGSVPFYFPLK